MVNGEEMSVAMAISILTKIKSPGLTSFIPARFAKSFRLKSFP